MNDQGPNPGTPEQPPVAAVPDLAHPETPLEAAQHDELLLPPGDEETATEAAPVEPTLIESPFPAPTPQAVEVPEPHVTTDRNQNTIIPQLSTEAKNIIGTKVDEEGKPVGRIDLEQVPVVEAYVQNIKAALAEGQAGIDKANEAFKAVLEIIEAGPQQEFGQQLGVNTEGGQTSSRKMDMNDPVDAARVNEIQTRQDQYRAAVNAATRQPETPVVTETPAPQSAEPIIDRVPTQEELEDLRVQAQPEVEEIQPESPEVS